ncbi:uncharacterized protein LOC114867818 isoform X2 [Betta splendens]|uniref:Uncharacterized protein LOC114867818 isoform X2 n=1 Tax=Betta splendens TaxID=158456 RepID=A0A6P7P320_BETSP|nr:uncharacterized protein LOC114867818 isoform X2 [Betta splendens]
MVMEQRLKRGKGGLRNQAKRASFLCSEKQLRMSQEEEASDAVEVRTNMTLLRVLLFCCLLHTGVKCDRDAVFVYSRLRGSALLPCTARLHSDCSLISWTFYKGGDRNINEVIGGQVSDSARSSRLSVTSNCSLHLHDLRVDDAGSYVCWRQSHSIANVYLSLLTITSPSTLTDLQPGGNLSLSCVLFTYYDAGGCKSYSSAFSLSWMDEDGTPLPTDGRYEIVEQTRCSVLLVTTLQREDNSRRWRCQVETSENSSAVFQDFSSIFLLNRPLAAQTPGSPATMHCPVELPISRIVLCAALPVMVIVVSLWSRRTGKHLAKTSAAATELQEINS